MRRTQILLPEPLHDALRERGFDERTSLGEQVRRAVELYLGLASQVARPGIERETRGIRPRQIRAKRQRSSPEGRGRR